MHSELSVTPKQRVLTGQQRTFCEGIVKGLSSTKAYQLAYPDSSPESTEANAYRLMENDGVKAAIEAMRQRVDVQKGGAVLTAKEKREYLARVVRAKPSDAALDNPDCNLVMTKMGPVALFPDKLAAIKLDNDLSGDGQERVLRLELIASSSDSPPPLDALDVESVVSREGEPQRGDS